MGQMGFFDVANHYAGLDSKADPLVKLTAMVPWEDFRPRLEGIWRRSPADKKSPEALGRGRDLQGDRAVRTLQPLR
jgi:hypothetical protein